MTDVLYAWPDAARFGRVVPKTKFYDHTNLPVSVKDRFVADVQRITWAYKLAESTINLAGTSEVPEIQVFEIEAKHQDVADVVLTAIDKAVQSPVIFEIRRGNGPEGAARMVAAHKHLGTKIPKLGPYLSTGWKPTDHPRSPLPTAVNLPSLYTALLQPLTPFAASPGENVSDVVGRLAAVRRLEREVTTLERRLRNEPQLNRKVELRRTLRAKQADLAELRSATDSPAAGNTN